MNILTRVGRRLIPRNRFGDRYAATWAFVAHHGRFPRRRGGGLNDAYFYIKTSNEILDPLRVFTTDKEYLKLYVEAKLGGRFNVPTIAVLESPEEAITYPYPDDCVIKPTHMSGQVMFRRNASPISEETLVWWFNSNYYLRTREANYRYLRPKLIVEPFIFGGAVPDDIKITCVHGDPKLIWVDSSRQSRHERSLYTPDWEYIPARYSIKAVQGPALPRPANLAEMLDIARVLSRDFNLIRVDLYTNGEDIHVGELTNVSGNIKATFSSRATAREVTRLVFGNHGFRVAEFRGNSRLI
jgi:hypothetical protein